SIGAMRAAGAARVLVAGATEAVVDADGVVCDLAEAARAFERARALRPAEGDDDFELWARTPAPGSRAGWRDLLAECEAAGATGLTVGHAPNLLDILRNPEEDDRQDLAMAVG